jgi:hypothetical protein
MSAAGHLKINLAVAESIQIRSRWLVGQASQRSGAFAAQGVNLIKSLSRGCDDTKQ